MKKYAAIVLVALIMSGCTPKIGKDIFIEPQGNLRWENSKSEVMLGVLSLLGVSTKQGEIRLGTDLKLLNKWHSDIKVVSLTYTLADGKEIIAHGEAKTGISKSLVIPSDTQRVIPLEFRMEPKHLNANRILDILQSKRKLFVRGDAVVEVWGVQKHYPFEKEVSAWVEKSLKGE